MTKKRQQFRGDAVSAVEDLKKKERERQMSPEERKETKRQAARSKATYDLPKGVQDAIASIAEQEGISASAVAALFLSDTLCRYREKKISFEGVKQESRSPRWKYVVDSETILLVLHGNLVLGNE